MSATPKLFDVTLDSGAVIRVPLCPRCGKADISAPDFNRLWRGKVRLQRCRCTAREKQDAKT